MLGEAVGGSSNIYQDFDGALRNITATAAEAAAKAKITTNDLHAGLGLAGIVTSVGAERIVEAKLPFASVIADNDAYAACVGAFGGGDGGIVIGARAPLDLPPSTAFATWSAAGVLRLVIMVQAPGSAITQCAVRPSLSTGCFSQRR